MELSNKLVIVLKKMGKHFTLKGRPVTYPELCSDVGMLPALTKRADQLASLCMGYGLGAKYENAEDSLLGQRVMFDEFTADSLRIFCIIDVLQELVKLSPDPDSISLDELMYE